MTKLSPLCPNLCFKVYVLFSKYDHMFHYMLASREFHQSTATHIHITKSKETPGVLSISFELKHCKLKSKFSGNFFSTLGAFWLFTVLEQRDMTISAANSPWKQNQQWNYQIFSKSFPFDLPWFIAFDPCMFLGSVSHKVSKPFNCRHKHLGFVTL